MGLTAYVMQIASKSVSKNMPMKPTKRRVFRPAFSTRNRETIVMPTLIVPMARVAYCAADAFSPAILKILVEKNMTLD